MTAGLPSVTIAANAVPGRGGQGQNLAMITQALDGPFAVRVLDHDVVPPSAMGRALSRVPGLRRRRDWITTLNDRQFDRGVARQLVRTDLFHGATGQCEASQAAARGLGARVALDSVTLHVADFGAVLDASCMPFGIRPPVGAGLRASIAREYEGADLIRVMSTVARRSFEAHGVASTRLVTVPPYVAVPPRPPARQDTTFRVGFAGLLEPWKGFHYLVEAFGALSIPGAELLLFGGPGSRAVSNYLKDAMRRWPGIMLRALEIQAVGLAAAYAPLAVLVHPSLADGFGLVVLEAMACSVPVVVSTAAGASDLVEDGVNGFLVPPGDRDAIADRLALLARDPDRRHAMGMAARRTAETLTRDAFVSRYVPALKRLLA